MRLRISLAPSRIRSPASSPPQGAACAGEHSPEVEAAVPAWKRRRAREEPCHSLHRESHGLPAACSGGGAAEGGAGVGAAARVRRSLELPARARLFSLSSDIKSLPANKMGVVEAGAGIERFCEQRARWPERRDNTILQARRRSSVASLVLCSPAGRPVAAEPNGDRRILGGSCDRSFIARLA